jgi:hypothetical protein
MDLCSHKRPPPFIRIQSIRWHLHWSRLVDCWRGRHDVSGEWDTCQTATCLVREAALLAVISNEITEDVGNRVEFWSEFGVVVPALSNEVGKLARTRSGRQRWTLSGRRTANQSPHKLCIVVTVELCPRLFRAPELQHHHCKAETAQSRRMQEGICGRSVAHISVNCMHEAVQDNNPDFGSHTHAPATTRMGSPHVVIHDSKRVMMYVPVDVYRSASFAQRTPFL